MVVIGSLLGAGPDSARLTATALDASDGRTLADLELRDASDRVDRLADSLTVRLLRELGRTRRIEVFRTASLGSTTLPALKAFLRGEQWFRRASWDSAMVAYDEAIRLDSTFALPLWRSGQVLGWAHAAGDSVSVARAIRAGALAHGLAPRDSLLLTADSILAMLYRDIPRVSPAAIRRVFTIAEDLTRRYPDDAESWYLLGDVRFHWGAAAGHTPREALDAFDHAIRLDSALAPAYIHAVELALSLDGAEAGHRYAKAYLDLGPTNASSAGIRLADQLMARPGAPPANADSLLRAASPSALREARSALGEAADSGEAAVALSRALAAAPPGDAAWFGPAVRELGYGVTLLYRGHVRQAAKICSGTRRRCPLHMVETALVSSSLPEGADLKCPALVCSTAVRLMALPVYAASGGRRGGDSVAVRRVARGRGLARARYRDERGGTAALPGTPRWLCPGVPRAYPARHGGRPSAPWRHCPTRSAPCAICSRMTLGHLLAARKEDEKAAKLLDRWLVDVEPAKYRPWGRSTAARVAERLGDRTRRSGPTSTWPTCGGARSRAAAIRGRGERGVEPDDERAEVNNSEPRDRLQDALRAPATCSSASSAAAAWPPSTSRATSATTAPSPSRSCSPTSPGASAPSGSSVRSARPPGSSTRTSSRSTIRARPTGSLVHHALRRGREPPATARARAAAPDRGRAPDRARGGRRPRLRPPPRRDPPRHQAREHPAERGPRAGGRLRHQPRARRRRAPARR